MDYGIILYVLAVFFGLLGIFSLAKRTGGKESRKILNWFGAIFLVLGVFMFVWQFGVLSNIGLPLQPLSAVGSTVPQGVCTIGEEMCVGSNAYTCVDGSWINAGQVAGKCGVSGTAQPYQPTATYSTINHWSSASISGTAYYKAGIAKATTTAISNVDPSTTYKYWVSNATHYVEPITFIGSGTKTITNDKAYQNGTITINAYDLINNQAISASSHNATLSSGTAKLKFTVLGAGSTSALPFGGVLVVEANSSISQIICSGDGLSLTPSTKYQVTYSPTYTNYRYVIYEVDPGYDISPNGLQGVTKTFECDFVSSTDPAGPNITYKASFIPANYYYVNDLGDFVLDVEQKLNGLTTRTGYSEQSFTGYWS